MKGRIQVISEDWMALWLGLFIFLGAIVYMVGLDVYGWAAKVGVWTSLGKAVNPVSKTFAWIPSFMSIFLTYIFLLVLMMIGAKGFSTNLKRFALGFTIIFWISYSCLIVGHWAPIAATTDQLEKFNLNWSLNLTGEAGFVIALSVGLIIGNFFSSLTSIIEEATRPELYIKMGIVIMGGTLGVKALEAGSLASTVIFLGLCAVVVAYLIFWAAVYFIARKYFKFNREWAAPLASGISICGVSAAIATGAAIRARPVVPIMVSSLVVIFSVVELLILPFLGQHFLWNEPMVAGGWMGLAVKSDGAAVASGAIVDSLIRAKALAESGINYKEGWILMCAATVKVFIDIFIGVWSFILAIIWCSVIEHTSDKKLKSSHIWERFPKFVLGYTFSFIMFLIICGFDNSLIPMAKAATNEVDLFRGIFFCMTFFTIGVASNFKKLWEEGIGKLVAIYILCLFGFIIWVALIISWIFFHGVKPPLV